MILYLKLQNVKSIEIKAKQYKISKPSEWSLYHLMLQNM
jgi:hypothetical protein